MEKKLFEYALTILIAVIIAVLVGRGINSPSIDRRPPIKLDRMEPLHKNAKILYGREMIVRIWREKVRGDCPLEARHFAYDDDGKEYHLESAVKKGGKVGAPFVDVIIDTRRLPINRYTFKNHVTYFCPDGGIFPIPHPLMKFEIVPETQ